MKKICILFLSVAICSGIFSQTPITKFEESGGKESPTYQEIIDWWQKLDKQSDYIKMLTMGTTDAGYPLHLVLISADKDFNLESLKKKIKELFSSTMAFIPASPMV